MSTTCSDPGFVVLQPLFRLGKWGKGDSFILLVVSFIRTFLAETAMTSPSLFSVISTSVPSTVHVVLLLALQGVFPPLYVPCAFLLEARNLVSSQSDLHVCADVSIIRIIWPSTILNEKLTDTCHQDSMETHHHEKTLELDRVRTQKRTWQYYCLPLSIGHQKVEGKEDDPRTPGVELKTLSQHLGYHPDVGQEQTGLKNCYDCLAYRQVWWAVCKQVSAGETNWNRNQNAFPASTSFQMLCSFDRPVC